MGKLIDLKGKRFGRLYVCCRSGNPVRMVSIGFASVIVVEVFLFYPAICSEE